MTFDSFLSRLKIWICDVTIPYYTNFPVLNWGKKGGSKEVMSFQTLNFSKLCLVIVKTFLLFIVKER